MYAGQPIAIAVAETEALAADAIELIEVELEHVEAVTDVEGAVLPGAARARLHDADAGDDGDLGDAHASVAAGGVGDEEELSENVLGTARLVNGDVDAAFAASAAVVRGRFHTPWVYQGYLETQTATAWFDVGRRTGREHFDPGAVHDPRSRSRRCSGSPSTASACAARRWGRLRRQDDDSRAAGGVGRAATRRPVRLAMTRSEDFAAANPAGAEVLEVEVGADREGKLTGIRTRIWCDRGSTDSMGVESIAAMLSAGPYRWQAHHLTCYGVSTNRVTFGAYRAPTAPPAAFAVESMIDELARRLGHRPARATPAQRARPRRQDRGRPGDEGVRRARVPRAPWWAPSLEPARVAAGGRGDRPRNRLVAGRVRTGGRRVPARLRRAHHGHHRRVRHDRGPDDVRRDRRRGIRRQHRPCPRRQRGHLERSLRRRERRQQDHLHGRPRGRDGRAPDARAAARRRRRGARDRARGPRDRRRRRCGRSVSRPRRWRSRTSRRRCSRSGARIRRSRDRAWSHCRRSPSPPPTCRTCASTARPVRSRCSGT